MDITSLFSFCLNSLSKALFTTTVHSCLSTSYEKVYLSYTNIQRPSKIGILCLIIPLSISITLKILSSLFGVASSITVICQDSSLIR